MKSLRYLLLAFAVLGPSAAYPQADSSWVTLVASHEKPSEHHPAAAILIYPGRLTAPSDFENVQPRTFGSKNEFFGTPLF